MSSTAARSTIQAVHALAQSPRNSPQPYEAPAAPCVRLQTMVGALSGVDSLSWGSMYMVLPVKNSNCQGDIG